jgi:hypothetical protein
MTLRDLKPDQLKDFAKTSEDDREDYERRWAHRENNLNATPVTKEERWNIAFSRGVVAVLKKLQSLPNAKS